MSCCKGHHRFVSENSRFRNSRGPPLLSLRLLACCAADPLLPCTCMSVISEPCRSLQTSAFRQNLCMCAHLWGEGSQAGAPANQEDGCNCQADNDEGFVRKVAP